MWHSLKKTLDNRVKGRVCHGSYPGPNTVLSKEEEDGLVSYVLYIADTGFPLTKMMVLPFAWGIAMKFEKLIDFQGVIQVRSGSQSLRLSIRCWP